MQGPCHRLQQGHQGGHTGRLGSRRSLAPAAEPRRGCGEDLPPTPLLPAETRRGGDPGAPGCDRRPTGVLAPFKAYATARFTDTGGSITAPQALTEIRAQGYRGSVQAIRKHFAALRDGTAEPVRADIPSPRKITSWIMCRREDLSTKDDERLLQVRLACPDITRACDLARTFHDLVTYRRGHLLMDWIRQAEQDAPAPVRGFAGFLRQDLDAVTAGLTLEWSSGVVEDNVNRVKTIKRSMYNRASFRLLRIRILTRP
ncbi:transposase [Streptomyces sp. CNQ431]|uniref:transposase n=1 Tax=Streptomyces sp. CNQ431 TaxID=1571532 RepID=UPI0038D0CF48